MMKSANLKTKNFQFFFSEPERSSALLAERRCRLGEKGGGGKEEKERHTGKRGEETKISVFVEAGLQGPSKSEKKSQVRRGGQNGGGSENGWAGTHSQPIQ